MYFSVVNINKVHASQNQIHFLPFASFKTFLSWSLCSLEDCTFKPNAPDTRRRASTADVVGLGFIGSQWPKRMKTLHCWLFDFF